MSGRHLREQWVDVAHATHARQDASMVTLAFQSRDEATAFYQSCCTGRETTSGEIRHDEELHCPVHS